MPTTTLSLLIFTAAFSLLSSASHSTPTPLLALNCTPPPLLISTPTRPSLTRLLDHLIAQTQTTHFSVSSVVINETNITGLVQCRPDLNQTRCNTCAWLAKRTILRLCQNSESVSAWLDGCYFGASMARRVTLRSRLFAHSCSGEWPVHRVEFEPDLDTLLMRMRSVGVYDDQFSYGNTISVGGRTIHGQVECVRTLSASECRSCVEQAVDKLQRSCLHSSGGYVVIDRCLATFETLGFSASTPELASGTREGGGQYARGEERKGGNEGRVRRVVLLCWGVAVICVAGFVWSMWLIQRSIVNRAKIAAIDCTMIDDSGKL